MQNATWSCAWRVMNCQSTTSNAAITARRLKSKAKRRFAPAALGRFTQNASYLVFIRESKPFTTLEEIKALAGNQAHIQPDRSSFASRARRIQYLMHAPKC
jgi:hypothetical protein